MIQENVQLEDASDRDRWNEIVVAAMAAYKVRYKLLRIRRRKTIYKNKYISFLK